MNISRNPKTGMFYFRKRVPEPLRPALGWELKRSLGTKDHREAKRRYPEAASWAERLLANAEAPLMLTQRDIDGLAGEWYRRQLGLLQERPKNGPKCLIMREW